MRGSLLQVVRISLLSSNICQRCLQYEAGAFGSSSRGTPTSLYIMILFSLGGPCADTRVDGFRHQVECPCGDIPRRHGV